jgi:uncharacterized membrane protein YhaH (DUF805 family)
LTDLQGPAVTSRPRGAFWWVAGRASRREYWIWVALLMGAGFLLSRAPPVISLGLTAGLVLAQIRRAHDFGRSGWWAGVATMATVVATVAVMPLSATAASLAGVGLELALIVLFGALPGDKGDNRFGSPPPFTVRRVLTGR